MAFLEKVWKWIIGHKLVAIIVASVIVVGSTLAIVLPNVLKKETVTYSFETGGMVTVESVTVEKGEEYKLPEPTKEGYEFEGWYLNAEFNSVRVTEVVASENATYYAKWAKLATITLDLNGGSLSQTSLSLKVGGNVYEFMQNYKPQKGSLQFGAWFNGASEISETLKMPEAGLTLKAQYKVAYTTEIYLQKLDLSGYEDPIVEVNYEYVGATKTSVVKNVGFKEVQKTSAESTGATISTINSLSENASENVFRHYFNRESYKVTFNPNYPVDGAKEARSETVLFGNSISVPNDYECEGYCLIGWSTSASSKVAEYNAYYIDTVLYNGGGTERASDKFSPEMDTVLYAVWVKGHVDLFGGDDYVYLFEEGVAYLARGNVFFQGFYFEESQMIIFGDKNGTVYENNTFCYMNDGKTFYLSENGEIIETTNLILTNNTVEYSNQKTGEKSYGTFVRGEGVDCYVATFDRGPLSGQTLTIKTKVIDAEDEDSNGITKLVFSVRNEEHLALGEMIRVVFTNGNLGTYYPLITLDGFGVATFASATTEQTYYYTLEGDFLSLSTNEGGNAALEARIVDLNGFTVWVLYDEVMDQTFTLANGDALTLDGGIFATYTIGGVEKAGYYSTSESLFGTLVTFIGGGETYTFLIKENKSDDLIAGDTSEVTYTIESKPVGYAEYRYFAGGADSTVYNAPLLVLNDEQEGFATLYTSYITYTTDSSTGEKKAIPDKDYEKVSTGTWELNQDGYYIYNAIDWFEINAGDKELWVSPCDLTTIQSILFKIDTTSTEYSLMTWKAYTTKDAPTAPVTYEKTYTSANGYTLKLIGGFAVLSKPNEESFAGAYVTKDGLTTIISGEKYRYVELGEDNTFVLLTEKPYTATVLSEKDEKTNDYVILDGKGNATYVKVITPATKETPAVTEETQGKVVVNGKTSAGLKDNEEGSVIYLFTANDGSMTFKFINIDSSYIAKLSANYNGDYETDSEILKLDGFGNKATYMDAKGNTYYGLYNVKEDNVIIFYDEEADVTFYFDLKVVEGVKTFTVRGSEYGYYLFVDNQRIESYIDLNGYDQAKLYQNVDDDGNPTGDVQTVSYTYANGIVTFTYTKDSDEITVHARISTYEYNNTTYNSVVAIRSEVVRTYVNESDWSVLILDELGGATKYTAEGKKITGSYVIVNEEFLYYVNDDLEDACVYTYGYNEQSKKWTATPIKFKNRSYYTSDFARLVFYEYGYGYNGEERFYYYENSDKEVVMYRYAKEGEQANAYGFVEDNTFGAFTNAQAQDIKVKEYSDKTYYQSNGFGMNLTRGEETEAERKNYPVQVTSKDPTKYPLELLTFNPGASEEYISLASVVINNQTYSGYVVREKNDAGQIEFYLNIGYYRFFLDITYTGEESTYEITKMDYVQSFYSYTYLEYYYFYALYFGIALPNDFGMVYLCKDYDTAGEVTDTYFKGTFMEESGLKDSQGNLLSIEKAAYTYSGSSGVYGVEIEGKDGYTYSLYFGMKKQRALGRYGYVVRALTRHQTLDSTNGYSVTAEIIVYTEDETLSTNMLYTIRLFEGATELKAENLFVARDKICYVVRERAEPTEEEKQKNMLGKITKTTYYYIDLKVKAQGDTIEGGQKEVLSFESVTVEKEEMTTYYSGMSWVDISADKGVMCVVIVSESSSKGYIIETSEYDETTNSYTCSTENGISFVVTINNDGTATISSPETQEALES